MKKRENYKLNIGLLIICVVFGLAAAIKTAASEAPGYSVLVHVVAYGEDIYSISRLYGVSIEALKSENDISGTLVKKGQRLKIPVDTPLILHESRSGPCFVDAEKRKKIATITAIARGIISIMIQVALIILCFRKKLHLLGAGFLISFLVGWIWGFAGPYLYATASVKVLISLQTLAHTLTLTGSLLVLLFVIKFKPTPT